MTKTPPASPFKATASRALAMALGLLLAAPAGAWASPSAEGPAGLEGGGLSSRRKAAAPASAAARRPAPAASLSPEAEGPGTWDGGVALPLAMTTLGGLSVAAMAIGFSQTGWNSTNSPNLLALGAGSGLVLGATFAPWLLRPKGSELAGVGPLVATTLSGTAMLLAPGMVELAGRNNGALEAVAILGVPLAFGTSLAWGLGDLAADAPARRGGPYPAPATTHILSTGTSLGAGVLGVAMATGLPQPYAFGGPLLVGLAPIIGLGVGHGSLGDAPRGMFLGASLYGPVILGAALPLLGTAGLTGSMTGGSGRYLGAMMAVFGAAAGLVGGVGAVAIDLEHRAGERQPRP